MEERCIIKDLSEGFNGFKMIRLITPEDRSFPRSFNNRACDTNKTDKFNDDNNNNNNNNNNDNNNNNHNNNNNNNIKVPASCNQ